MELYRGELKFALLMYRGELKFALQRMMQAEAN